MLNETEEPPVLSSFARADEFLAGVAKLTDVDLLAPSDENMERDERVQLSQLCQILDEYQEQPYLLDPSLESIVTPVVAALRRALQSDSPSTTSGRVANLAKLLYWLTKVRGSKTIVRFFPHEVSDLSFLLGLLSANDSPSGGAGTTTPMKSQNAPASLLPTWELRYILLLWLSVCIRLPFSFRLLAPGAEESIVSIGLRWLGTSGKESDAAAQVVGRYFSRDDVDLARLLDLCERQLACPGDSVPLLPLLAALYIVLACSAPTKLQPTLPRLYALIALLPEANAAQIGAALAKLRAKVAGRVGLAYLSAAGADDGAAPVPEEVEVIVGELIEGLAHPDSISRYTAAKYLARISLQSPPDLAAQVVDTVLADFESALSDDAQKSGEGRVQGACLAIGEMARTGVLAVLPESERSGIVKRVLRNTLQALRYDHLTALHVVGASVRDSAAYVLWSLARTMSASTITASEAQELAEHLLCTACLDREVSVRRAASAAWQEAVGRWGVFAHGIATLRATDFFTVSIRHRAYLQGAVEIASYDEYRSAVLARLAGQSAGESADTGIAHYDVEIRTLSAKTLGKIAEHKAEIVLPSLIHQQLARLPVVRKDANKLQGVLLALAALADATESLPSAEAREGLRNKPSVAANRVRSHLLTDLDSRSGGRQQAAAVLIGSLDFNKPSLSSHRVLVYQRLCQLLRREGKGAANSVEARRNGVTTLGRIVETCSSRDGLTTTSGNSLESAYEALLDGFSDYTSDSRGDVGSWVRMATITAWQRIIQTVRVPEHITQRVIAAIAGLALERLDSVRQVAGEALVSIAQDTGPNSNSVTELSPLLPIKSPANDLATWRDIEWASSRILPLLAMPQYRTTVLEGAVSSNTQFHANSAFADFVTSLPTTNDDSAAADGVTLTLPDLLAALLSLAKSRFANNRVFIPLLSTLAQLAESGSFDAAMHSGETDECSQLLRALLRISCSALEKTKSKARLSATSRVLAAFLALPPAAAESVQEVPKFLQHPQPWLRQQAAENLFNTVSAFYPSETEESELEALLTETDWALVTATFASRAATEAALEEKPRIRTVQSRLTMRAGPSTARPLASTTSAHLTPPPALLSDLAALRDPTRVSDDLWAETTEQSVLWLLKLEGGPGASAATTDPSGKGKGRATVDEDGVALDGGLVHWFCGAQGARDCWEPAVFCIRLLGMKRVGEVASWRDRYERLIAACPACVEAFQRAKYEFIEHYLRHYKPEKSIETFTNGVENIEYTSVMQAFATAGFEAPPSSGAETQWHPSRVGSLAGVSPAALHNVLVNPRLYENEDVLALLAAGFDPAADLELARRPSPGLLALRLHYEPTLRAFATKYLEECSRLPSADWFRQSGMAAVVDSHLGVMASRDRGETTAVTGISMPYTDDLRDFMEGLASCLAALSTEAIGTHLLRKGDSSSASLDVVHLIASHLGDAGDHLLGVLRAFRVLLERLGARFWSVGDERYEEVVLHAILDNSQLHDALEIEVEGSDDAKDRLLRSPWWDWVFPFILSVAESANLFVNSLALFASTFLDRLQQQRFDSETRTRALQIALLVFGDVFLGAVQQGAAGSTSADLVASAPRYPHAAAAEKVLELHSASLVQFAFAASFATAEWTAARDSTRAFVAGIMRRDGKAVSRAVFRIANFAQQTALRQRREEKRTQRIASGDATAAKEPEAPPIPIPRSVTFVKPLWDHAYGTIREIDISGVALLLQGVAPTAQFEKLTSRTWAVKDLVRPQMKAVNDALAAVRDPIISLLVAVAEERPQLLLDFLGIHNVVVHLVALLFSPVEAVSNAAQGFVKQAYDVTTRRDVFYRLAERHTEQTLRGLATVLQTFQTSAKSLPEACGVAKRVVRCCSDVLDVFCAHTDGLLRDPDFVNRNRTSKIEAKLLALWKLMGEALALLFKQTPQWSSYFENDDMTEWMRDAVLFGADMLDQIRVLELVISGQTLDSSVGGATAASPSKTRAQESSTAEQMIAALADPLEELIAWLRLNDEDLLHQSYQLVLRMISRFTRSRIRLRDTTFDKLRRISDKPADRNGQRRSTILREDQLLGLREALDDNDAAVRRRISGAGVLELSDDEDSSAGRYDAKSLRVSGEITRSSAPPARTAGAKVSSKSKVGPSVSSRPRGVPWTTYSSKKASASESESSEDEATVRGADGKKLTGLALLAKDQKPALKKVEPRRGVKAIGLGLGNREEGSSKANGRRLPRQATEEDRQAIRAARMRAAQDLSKLHRAILQWDPACEEEKPPNVQLLDRLPTAFKSPQDYAAAFEPLLLTECWEQIRQAKAEALKEGQVYRANVAGRQSVDDFVDVFCTIDQSELRDRVFFSDTDFVWLRQGQRHIFAKVQGVSRKREHMELTLRCHLGKDNHDAGSGLAPRTAWELVKLVNLSTVHREYSALRALEYIDLCADVLAPRPPPSMPTDAKTINTTMSAYRVNEPQAMAIHAALRTSGFSLIQGPPGTGKTSTIVGLVGAFIDSRPRIAAQINVGRSTDPSQVAPVAKVLLCAPSNAAVDEVAKRLKEGVRLMDGSLYMPKVVRIGADSAVDVAVKDVFIDELVERATSGNRSNSGSSEAQAKMQTVRAEIDSLRVERDIKQAEMDSVANNEYRRGEINLELRKIKTRIFDLSQQLDSEKDKAQQSRRAMDAEQRKMRLKILSEADVICSTLSGAGHDYMAQLPFDFETVIIDEAAQSIELSSLIPLKYGCSKCILVGDPLQLPPTVISAVASRNGYNRSLFVRVMERGPQAVHLLSIQYRMHPNISAFPSAAFYQSRLSDGPDMHKKTLQPWHANALFPPYAFLHVEGREQVGRQHSYTNPVEAATAAAIFDRLRRDYPTIDFSYRIGIVTPYKGQVGELKRTFRHRYGEEILSKIAFNTVDGFQGQEKDIIILSCVRGGSADKGVGFLADTRRMNVALTRARSSIWILGDAVKLRSNQYWNQLIADAEARNMFRKADVDTFRSAAFAPPLVQATTQNRVVKSKASALEMHPAYGPVVGSQNAAGAHLVAPAPAHMVPVAVGNGVPQKRGPNGTVDPQTASSASKRPKLEAGATPPPNGAIVQRSQLSTNGSGPAAVPPVRPVIKRPPPSLFVPKKRK
ncbi:hypothetical protein JCM10908_007072 [Rhodotorula pacifica]|uniref:uncharacterized protein n=1 Tax=Rhodotorula pacifica TaxID=1495444 RepID=UPI00316F8D31